MLALGACVVLAGLAAAQTAPRPAVRARLPAGSRAAEAGPALAGAGAWAAPATALALPVAAAAAPDAAVSRSALARLAAARSGPAARLSSVRGTALAEAVRRAAEADGPAGIVARAGVLDSLFDGRVAANDARFLRELKAPAKVLGRVGVERTISVYGSARLVEPALARERLAAAQAAAKARPKDRAARAALMQAHNAARMSKYYEETRRFARLVAERTGGRVAVVTGGGPGIMEAANRGAREAGGPSIGYNIHLPAEQGLNPYVTPGMAFEFEDFSTRKKGLRHAADAHVFSPGGFGTLDELFEALCLVQTGKLPKAPIVLLGGKSFWKDVLNVHALARRGVIAREDLKLISFVETAEQAWNAIARYYPKRREYSGR